MATHRPRDNPVASMNALLATVKQHKDEMKLNGAKELEDLLWERLSEWRTISTQIGVIGLPGVGKSSLINSIRGLRANDPVAAPTSVTQHTGHPTAYPHPDNENLVLWDLPGIRAPGYPKETYMKQIHFESYDFFLLLGCARFREEDSWMTKNIKGQEKRFFYIRTKVDFDLLNERHDRGDDYNEDDVLREIRRSVGENLQNYPDQPVFLVNNHDIEALDFQSLKQRLVEDVPQWKKEHLLHSLTSLSTDIIALKVDVLYKRLRNDTASSAGVAVIRSVPSVPREDITENVVIIQNTRQYYYNQFGLNREALGRIADRTGSDVNALQEIADEGFPRRLLTAEVIKVELVENAAFAAGRSANAAANVLGVVPILGGVVLGGRSVATVYSLLQSSVEKLQNAAKNAADRAIGTAVVSYEI